MLFVLDHDDIDETDRRVRLKIPGQAFEFVRGFRIQNHRDTKIAGKMYTDLDTTVRTQFRQ